MEHIERCPVPKDQLLVTWVDAGSWVDAGAGVDASAGSGVDAGS